LGGRGGDEVDDSSEFQLKKVKNIFFYKFPSPDSNNNNKLKIT